MTRSHFLWWYIPVIAWALLIFTLTSIPTLETPSLGFDAEDKLYHFIVYFVFGFLLTRALLQDRIDWLKKSLIAGPILGALFAAFDEFHQLFIPGRSCDIADALADISGILVAQIAFYFLYNKLHKRIKVIYKLMGKW